MKKELLPGDGQVETAGCLAMLLVAGVFFLWLGKGVNTNTFVVVELFLCVAWLEAADWTIRN